ncbi:DinB family protein [Daejeonella oryzae]|uniref:DinB family protein n=1 Tax=Daejeonella oryzae TaxID=1122943 RepID=UPI000402D0F9|nr:DinB family protein [Daejeonella oryzae]
MDTTHQLIALWIEGRTRFSNQLNTISEADLPKTLAPAPNSAGFLIRHIGDVELLFAKNVFNALEVQVHAQTVISQKDTGQWTNLQDLLNYVQKSYDVLKNSILMQPQNSWEEIITTKEFGTKTKIETLGRITTHTAYHAGQLALIVKYGLKELSI